MQMLLDNKSQWAIECVLCVTSWSCKSVVLVSQFVEQASKLLVHSVGLHSKQARIEEKISILEANNNYNAKGKSRRTERRQKFGQFFLFFPSIDCLLLNFTSNERARERTFALANEHNLL